MSTYENYTRTASHYDQTRIPVGTEILAGCLTACGKALGAVHLLDAGCGTGAYSLALVDQIARIDAVDLNPEMLAVAQRKLAPYQSAGRLRFARASLLDLPFPDGHFDAVMINQVLHHLETGENPDYPAHRQVCQELHRVLRSGGVAVINGCDHRQLEHGYWYYDLIPEALRGVLKRCISGSRLTAMLDEAGFRFGGRFVPLDGVMQGDAYFDRLGPLRPEWRAGDSLWAMATSEQVARAETRVRQLHQEGLLESYFAAQDAERSRVGQFTFFLALKP